MPPKQNASATDSWSEGEGGGKENKKLSKPRADEVREKESAGFRLNMSSERPADKRPRRQGEEGPKPLPAPYLGFSASAEARAGDLLRVLVGVAGFTEV